MLLVGFFKGLASPLKGMRMIAQHPVALLPFLPVPFCISLLYLIGAWALWGRSDDAILAYLGGSGTGWWSSTLNSVSSLIFALVSWFSFSMVGMILASPFNDMLAVKVMKIRGLQVDDPPFVQSMIRAVVDSSKLAVVKLVMSVITLFFPPLFFPFLVIIVLADHFDYPWSHQTHGLRGRSKCLKRDLMPGLGFGLLFAFVYAIPFLGLLLMPLAVVSAACCVGETPADLAMAGEHLASQSTTDENPAKEMS